jgi:hypothetical protein
MIRRASMALLALGAWGCTVDPFCFHCADGGHGGGPDAARDGASAADGAPAADACLDEEDCNGWDDDCDGRVDEGIDLSTDVRHCGACGRACRPAHAFGRCAGGSCGIERCDVGYVDLDGEAANGCEYECVELSPAVDLVCDGRDDDCDGRVDEDVNFASDVAHCGACGNACRFAHAIARCNAGRCEQEECEPGYFDADGDPANGCEYACTVVGSEGCNGRDDDCDGRVDEDLTPPATFCNPNGVCGATTARCSAAAGWVCDYPPSYQPEETRCDGLDNDCDGMVDEPFPLVGTACGNGAGACRRTGTYECNAAGDGVVCNAPPAGAPTDEACNGVDDDCDGRVDEVGADDPATPWRDAIDLGAIPHVAFVVGGRTVRIMQYEASRPDASASSPGTLTHLACSRPNVLPWTSVRIAEAQAACCALNPGGTCPGAGETGWRLCSAAVWEAACRGPAGTCEWSYAGTCDASQPLVCNGRERDCDPSTPDDDDCVEPTGSRAFPDCRTDWGAAGSVYDLSGNVREWTSTLRAPGVYELRGGSFTQVEESRRCGFSFAAAGETFAHPSTGFRCCHE